MRKVLIMGASDGLGLALAKCMKQLLELPKYMEVSEIVINRKVASISS